MNTSLTIAVKLSAYNPATEVGRAFDPDVGGADSFAIIRATDGVETWAVTDVPCSDTFAQQAEYLIANPAALHQAVLADFAVRWADLTPPTLADMETFCANARLRVGMGLDAALGDMGLVRVIPE